MFPRFAGKPARMNNRFQRDGLNNSLWAAWHSRRTYSLFEDLAVHSRIVVTGPQRSGTRIAARMIAKDTEHRFVDELEFDARNEHRWREILQAEQIVVQAPCMLKDVVDNPPPGVFIVLMRRDLAKIRASERRIGWDQWPDGSVLELRKFGLTKGNSARTKYDYWDSHEKKAPFLELEYEALRQHPLFIPDNQRRNFAPLQTRSRRFLALADRVLRHHQDRRAPQ
jgi:hypothetical protein